MAADNNYSLGPVPTSARKRLLPHHGNAWTHFLLCKYVDRWFLGTGLSFNDFFLAVLIGNLILGIYTSFLGYIPAHLLASLLTSLLVSLSVLKAHIASFCSTWWYTSRLVGVWALPCLRLLQKATGIDTNTLIVVSGLLMTGTVYFGIKALMVLSAVAVLRLPFWVVTQYWPR